MMLDATFWVAISFIIFILILVYYKIPQKIKDALNQNIKDIAKQIDEAEKLKEEAKEKLNDIEQKLGNVTKEIKVLTDKANADIEQNVIRTNEYFHKMMELRKKNAEDRILQMKNQAFKDIKNSAVKISIETVEKLLQNSMDKSKLDKIYQESIEETKLALKKKSS